MMKRILFVLALAVGCTCGEEAKVSKPSVSSIAVIAPEPEIKSAPPAFNRNLDTEAQRAAWLDEVAHTAQKVAALPDPAADRALLPLFRAPAKPVDPFLSKDGVRPTLSLCARPAEKPAAPADPAAAKQLELEGAHWDAGQLYVQLKDTAGVRRCAVALEKKLEWEAAGELAADIGDRKIFDRAVDAFEKAGMFSKFYELLASAAESGRTDFVRATLVRRGLHPELDAAEELAKAGDGDYLAHDLAMAVADDENIKDRLDDILLLSCFDPKAEEDFMADYLAAGGTVLTGSDADCGEGGCDGMASFTPLPQTVLVWAMVRDRADLRTAYAKRVSAELSPSIDGQPCNPNDLPTSFAAGPGYDQRETMEECLDEQRKERVARIKSWGESADESIMALEPIFAFVALDAAWSDILQKSSANLPPYARTMVRLMLGLKVDLSRVDGIRPCKRDVIAWLSGGTLAPGACPDADVFAHARLMPVDASRVWKALGLPAADPATLVPLAPSEIASAAQAARTMTDDQEDVRDILWARLVRAGYAEMPDASNGISCDQGERLAWCQTALAAVESKRAWPDADAMLADRLLRRITDAQDAMRAWPAHADALLDEPYKIIVENEQTVDRAGLYGTPVTPPLLSDKDADALQARAFAVVKAKAPRAAYERLLAEADALGHGAPFNAEVKLRASANDIAGVLRLQKAAAAAAKYRQDAQAQADAEP